MIHSTLEYLLDDFEDTKMARVYILLQLLFLKDTITLASNTFERESNTSTQLVEDFYDRASKKQINTEVGCSYFHRFYDPSGTIVFNSKYFKPWDQNTINHAMKKIFPSGITLSNLEKYKNFISPFFLSSMYILVISYIDWFSTSAFKELYKEKIKKEPLVDFYREIRNTLVHNHGRSDVPRLAKHKERLQEKDFIDQKNPEYITITKGNLQKLIDYFLDLYSFSSPLFD